MPPSKWKYPRVGTSWSECSFCGQDFPSTEIWLNPRYGWQCYKCWDGLIQRDQIMQPIFPGEGTRKTPAPVTDTLEQGVGGDLEPTYDYFLEDRITGDTYEVHLPPLSVTANGTIIYYTTSVATLTATTTTEPVYQGIFISGGWDVYVRNGALATEQSPNGIGIVYGICDFGPIPSNCVILMLDYGSDSVFTVDFSTVPVTTTPNPSPSGTIFTAVQVGDGFYVVLNGVLTAYTSTPAEGPVYANDCVQIDAQIGVEIPIVDTPPPVVPNPFTPPGDLTLLVDERWQDVFSELGTLVADERWQDIFSDVPTLVVDERWQS